MGVPVAIGIDVGGTKLVAASVSADGAVLARHRRVTPASDHQLLVTTLRDLVLELGAGVPVGIGIAALVSSEGLIRYGPNVDVRDLDLAAALQDVSTGGVHVLNDASAATLGEQRVGAARRHRDVVLVTLGTGVGGGIVVNGRLVDGAHGFAGEIGHIVVFEGGRRCPCGNRGCVEAYSSGTAMGNLAREWLAADPARGTSLRQGEDVTGRTVSEAASAGDVLAQEVLTEAGHWLGVALANVVNALDPSIVLVGGGAAAQASAWMLPAASAAMTERLVGAPWRSPPPLELASLGDDAGMIGAALFAADGGRADPDGSPPASGADSGNAVW